NINHLWPTYEYSKYTMRGGSQLALEQGKQQDGLDIAYATNWSYSPGEMPNLMIPNFNGGSSIGELTRDSETFKVLQRGGYSGISQAIKQMPLYWGPQPFTAGPMYMGAISVFLFIVGLLLIKGPEKWWLAVVSLLAVLLSWGSNLHFFTEFFFNYIPLYNKFRTVSMILVILQITIPLLAIFTLNKLLITQSNGISNLKGSNLKQSGSKERPLDKNRVKNALLISLGITVGASLLFALIPSLAGSFISNIDAQLSGLIRGALVKDRMALLSADALRSVIFILASGIILWLGYLGKLKRNLVISLFALLMVTDLGVVGHRYLNDNHFVKRRDFENQYALRPVDKVILEDQDPNYRVLDLSVNTFNDSHVSYHHKTIGGYSPAKLQTYQDMIDVHISREMAQFEQDIAKCTTIDEVHAFMRVYPVLNMLNTKYIIANNFIVDGYNVPVINKDAFGNSWFVSQIVEATTLTQEIESLGSRIDLSNTAVIHSQFILQTAGVSKDTLAADEMIVLTDYSPNKLTYQYNALSPRLAIFSEIYYPAGWKAYIDGEPVPIIKANYILRALNVPAGSHTVEFEFKPESFNKGAYYSSFASGILIVLFFLWALVAIFEKTGRKLIKKRVK
ncbi:MAG: YfhO family protein, partial [Bacteroidales bacterium]